MHSGRRSESPRRELHHTNNNNKSECHDHETVCAIMSNHFWPSGSEERAPSDMSHLMSSEMHRKIEYRSDSAASIREMMSSETYQSAPTEARGPSHCERQQPESYFTYGSLGGREGPPPMPMQQQQQPHDPYAMLYGDSYNHYNTAPPPPPYYYHEQSHSAYHAPRGSYGQSLGSMHPPGPPPSYYGQHGGYYSGQSQPNAGYYSAQSQYGHHLERGAYPTPSLHHHQGSFPSSMHHHNTNAAPERSSTPASFGTNMSHIVKPMGTTTPSPTSIPPPPHIMNGPLVASDKIKAPIPTRMVPLQQQQHPLGESSRHLNVSNNDDLRHDDGECKYLTMIEGRDDVDQHCEGTRKSNEHVSMQDASLLLGLRTTSSNGSPATVHTAEDSLPTLAEEEKELASSSLSSSHPLKKATKIKVMNKNQKVYSLPAPVPEKFPHRLARPEDRDKLNALHCFIRTELLEIFVIEPSKDGSFNPSSSIGRVGFRCVYCGIARAHGQSMNDEAPMAHFYPKNVGEIYRLVTSWQRCHLRKCRNLPPSIRKEWIQLRTDKSRGKTVFWCESAHDIGLEDVQGRGGGVCFDLDKVRQVMKEEEDQDTSAPATALDVMEEETTSTAAAIVVKEEAEPPMDS